VQKKGTAFFFIIPNPEFVEFRETGNLHVNDLLRWDMLNIFFAIDGGKHAGSKNFEMFKTNKIHLTPDNKKEKLGLSGEKIKKGHLPIKIEIHPNLVVQFQYPNLN
jgi:diacylglycerol kinase family enzyme